MRVAWRGPLKQATPKVAPRFLEETRMPSTAFIALVVTNLLTQTAPAASQPAASQPVLAGPSAVEDNAGKLTIVQRTFDGRVERAGTEADVVAINLLDLSPEQRAKYDEIRSARMTTFDQIVRSNYGLILELASFQGEPDPKKRTDMLARLQQALKPYADRGTVYQEMWPHLSDEQRDSAQAMLDEYRDARMDSLKREGGESDTPRAVAVRERLEVVGEMVRESIERQVGLERENFEQIASELELTPEQKSKAEAIFGPLAIKRLQNIEVTKQEQSAAFAEFNKLLTAGQKQKLFGMLLRQYQKAAPATSQPASSQPATPTMPE